MRWGLLTVCAALVVLPQPARAFDESTRRPFYVQSAFGSYSFWPGFSFGDQVYWKPDIEVGLHFNGRHDGLALGIRQAFDVGPSRFSLGETMIRGGWDFAFPFHSGRFELTFAPFGTFGVDYTFTNLNAGLRVSVGAEAKLFFFHGLYVLVRPIELGVGQFVNLGFGQKNVYFNMNMGVGAGFAF